MARQEHFHQASGPHPHVYQQHLSPQPQHQHHLQHSGRRESLTGQWTNWVPPKNENYLTRAWNENYELKEMIDGLKQQYAPIGDIIQTNQITWIDQLTNHREEGLWGDQRERLPQLRVLRGAETDPGGRGYRKGCLFFPNSNDSIWLLFSGGATSA